MTDLPHAKPEDVIAHVAHALRRAREQFPDCSNGIALASIEIGRSLSSHYADFNLKKFLEASRSLEAGHQRLTK
jgi:hypothetical protein